MLIDGLLGISVGSRCEMRQSRNAKFSKACSRKRWWGIHALQGNRMKFQRLH
jgi:hypothetical protein